jgi:Tol biopolymer transport system component
MRALRLSLCALLPSLLLAACGGGGGHSGGTFGTPLVALRAYLANDTYAGVYLSDAQGHLRMLNGPAGSGYGAGDFAWNPDHTRMAIATESAAGGNYDLYVADTTGADPVLLVASQGATGYVSEAIWSPDGTKLMFTGDPEGDGDPGLYVVSAAGGAAVRVSAPGLHVYYGTWHWSPDGARICFTIDNAPGFALYAVNADGTGHVRVSGTMVAGGGVYPDQARSPWCAGSFRLLFEADKLVDDLYELFVVNADGTGLAKRSTGSTVHGWRLSPDGAKVAYSDNLGTALHVVPVAGGATQPVSAPGESVGLFQWRPDSAAIAYVVKGANDVLKSGTITGAPPSLLVALSGANEDVGGPLLWSPDGSRLAYCAGVLGVGATKDEFRLYAIPAAGGTPVLVSQGLAADGNVSDYAWSPDSLRLLYRASVDGTALGDAFVAVADGSPGVQLSDSASAGVWVASAEWTTDGSGILFLQGTDPGASELFLADPTGAVVHSVLDCASPDYVSDISPK